MIEISINKDEARADEEEKEDEVEDDAEDDGGVKDDDGDSFTTAASSLSSVNVCKICHCGEEVREDQGLCFCLKSEDRRFSIINQLQMATLALCVLETRGKG